MSITAEIQQCQNEAREGWMPEKKSAPDFGEPWEHTSFRNCIRDRHNALRQLEDDLRDRSRVCVNACAGMADPAAEIQAMREAVKEARELLASLEYEGNEKGTRCILCGSHCSESHKEGCNMLSALAKLQPFLKPNLSDDEIKALIRKSQGWTELKEGPRQYGWKRGDEWHYLHNVPNYPLDLNACAEFEKTLTDEEWDVYCENLGGSLRSCASATPLQRAIAFLKTKGILP